MPRLENRPIFAAAEDEWLGIEPEAALLFLCPVALGAALIQHAADLGFEIERVRGRGKRQCQDGGEEFHGDRRNRRQHCTPAALVES